MSFAELFDWFDQVYIVNLPNRSDRRQETVAEFARVGVAIPNGKIRFFEATRPTNKEEFPSIGSLGNFISQTRVMKDALDNGFERILVCEDDLHLNDFAADSVKTVLEDLKSSDWTMASLGYLEPTTPPSDRVGLSPWDGDTLGAQFYAVRGDGIRGFHDYLAVARSRPSGHPQGGAMFFDGAFNMVRTQVPAIRFYIATPCLAGQRSSRTDLHDLRFYDRQEPFRTIMVYLRKLRNRLWRSGRKARPGG